MKKDIKLVNDTISKEDIDKLADWLKTYPKLTKGEKTIEFEEKWSQWLGTKYSVFVNSGSSANLMMLYALKLAKKLRNNKVVVPSLAWATDLAPVMQLGFEPLLVDANLKNLSVDLCDLEETFKKESPSILLLVSVLGLPPNMTAIKKLCEKYHVYLLEDTCESLGSMHKGQKLGTFGCMSSFSLYFGHHISTIEGGMVCTNDKELYDILKMIRSHGWDRDLDEEKQRELREKWNVDEFSALYTFYVPGFNLRSTDLQAFLGLLQLEKLDSIIQKRNENFKIFKEFLFKRDKCNCQSCRQKPFAFPTITWFPEIPEDDFVSSFCMPIIISDKGSYIFTKEKIVKKLQENSIETRPLIAGSLGGQPYCIEQYGLKEKRNCSFIDRNGFYVPNHPGLEREDIERICTIILDKKHYL